MPTPTGTELGKAIAEVIAAGVIAGNRHRDEMAYYCIYGQRLEPRWSPDNPLTWRTTEEERLRIALRNRAAAPFLRSAQR